MIRCLITDGRYSINPLEWIEHIAHWVGQEVEMIQIREKDLSPRDLAALTRQVLALRGSHGTKVLVNDRADVALACGADGVHLRDGSLAPEKFRRKNLIVSIACHDLAQAERILSASFVLLAPIFAPLSKPSQGPALGIDAIHEFSRRFSIPVLALGGITHQNARACVEAGAAGIAGITYFAR